MSKKQYQNNVELTFVKKHKFKAPMKYFYIKWMFQENLSRINAKKASSSAIIINCWEPA